MSDNQFKPGDVVQLKSGGVLMTIVCDHNSGKDITNWTCQWQNPSTGEVGSDVFSSAVLKKAE